MNKAKYSKIPFDLLIITGDRKAEYKQLEDTFICRLCKCLISQQFLQCLKCFEIGCSDFVQEFINDNKYESVQICPLKQSCQSTSLDLVLPVTSKKSFINKIFSSIQFNCPSIRNQTKNEQCQQIFKEQSEYFKHIQICDLINENCENCKKSISKKYVLKHLDECEFVERSCKWCFKKCKQHLLLSHEHNCTQKSICKQCKQPVRQVQLEKTHLLKCKNQIRSSDQIKAQIDNFLENVNDNENNQIDDEELLSQLLQLKTVAKQFLNKFSQELQLTSEEILDSKLQRSHQIVELETQISERETENKKLAQEIENLKKQTQGISQQLEEERKSYQIPELIKKNAEYKAFKDKKLKLKKDYLIMANKVCLVTDYWKSEWGKFYRNAGQFEDKNNQIIYHDPYGLMFVKKCSNCYDVLQKYKKQYKHLDYESQMKKLQKEIVEQGGQVDDNESQVCQF